MKPQPSSLKKSPVKAPAERVVKDIRRQTRRHFSAEDKIRIVLDGLRGDPPRAAGDHRRLVSHVEWPCFYRRRRLFGCHSYRLFSKQNQRLPPACANPPIALAISAESETDPI